MSGKDEARLKDEALTRIQQSLELHNMAVHTQRHAIPLGPLVADAFQVGVNRAMTEVDLEIRTYAHDHLGMVPRGHREDLTSDN